ncbi:hypothetical protein M427DRAFT_152898 [Gonapodya prolifera JEL478]|uniref:C2H2-type domain-containing protein n=1 Tax=Gonapodya prolifera (strain JEL478) TaxID=1344416 RepID=A0A139AQB1_GONPJ|nr:hypothetical protein M427DRAFT_152898 [Gonapodya prolifera JEL478]|eukprot:KXS18951.1 hypothetical protein M427DRAFT_152898 [Gonapodya prolifera JEL478]
MQSRIHLTSEDVESFASQIMKSADGKFRCPVPECAKPCATRYNCRSHLRTHQKDRPHELSCARCETGFHHPGDLKRHELRCSGDVPSCQWCGVSYGGFVKRHRLLAHEVKCQSRLAGATTSAFSTIALPHSFPSPTPSAAPSPNWTLFEQSPTMTLCEGENEGPQYSLPSPATSLQDNPFVPDLQISSIENFPVHQLEQLLGMFAVTEYGSDVTASSRLNGDGALLGLIDFDFEALRGQCALGDVSHIESSASWNMGVANAEGLLSSDGLQSAYPISAECTFSQVLAEFIIPDESCDIDEV